MAEGIAQACHGNEAQARRPAQSLPAAQTDRRTDVRTAQASQGVPEVPAAWAQQGQRRVGDGFVPSTTCSSWPKPQVISRPYRLPRTQCLVTCLPHSFRSRAPSQKFLLSSTTANNVVPWSKAVRISCSSRFGTTWGHPRRFVSKRPKGSAPSPPAPPIASQNLSRGQGAP